MTIKEYKQKLSNTPEEKETAQFFLGILCDHFLSENWYSMYNDQTHINEEMVYDIIYNNPKRSRNFIRKLDKFCHESKFKILLDIFERFDNRINRIKNKYRRIVLIIKEKE